MSNARTLASTINSSSRLVVPSGGIYFGISTDGTGGVTSGILDDYEEGTFSTALNDGTTDIKTSTGHYTKIGNFVYLKVQFGGGTATGDTGIVTMALPFAITNMGGGNVVHYSIANGGPGQPNVVYAQHLGGSDVLYFSKVAGSAATANLMKGSDYTSSSRLYFSYQYSTS